MGWKHFLKDNVCSLPAFIYLLTSWSWLCLWRFLFLLGHTYDYSSVTGGKLARALISRGENFCVFITLSPCNIDISIRLLDQCYVALQLSIDLNIETGSSTYYTNFVNALRSLTDDSGKTVFRTHSRWFFSIWFYLATSYYATAAPQCPFFDQKFGYALNHAFFDAVYVQFCEC